MTDYIEKYDKKNIKKNLNISNCYSTYSKTNANTSTTDLPLFNKLKDVKCQFPYIN